MTTMNKTAFRVVHAGPWEADTFGVVDAEVVQVRSGKLQARIQERGRGPLIRFSVDEVTRSGDLVILRTNAARKWILRALP